MFRSLRSPLSRILFTLTIAILVVSCGKGNEPQQSMSPDELQVSKSFVNDLVLPAYGDLADHTKVLQTSLDNFVNEPTAAHLATVRQDWKRARTTWETTESWAFGPATTLGLDGNLDDWPVSQLELSQALAKERFDQSVFDALGTTARGFHGIEFVLFGNGDAMPTATGFSSQELSYLALAGADLHRNADELLDSWSGASGFGSSLTGSDEEAQATIDEMLQGMKGTLEEVADEKVGAVLAEGTPDGLESRFSGNTSADLLANVSGARAVFEQTTLDGLVEAKAPEAAQQLANQLDVCVELAKALPANLKDTLDDANTQEAMKKFMDAVHTAVELTDSVIDQIS